MTKESVRIAPFAPGKASNLAATLTCPPDKSITHRALMFAAMAAGESRIEAPLLGADCRSTMGVFRLLGAQIDLVDGGAVVVKSPGIAGWRSPEAPLDFGNSGTTARLLTGLFAATDGLFVTAFGDASLSKRPMGRVVEPLRSVGAQIVGRDGGRALPMAITGRALKASTHKIDKATAQVKSALLLAGMGTDGTTTVELPAGSRDHTEKMLAALGAKVTVKQDPARGVETISITGPFQPQARPYRVPGDPSSAAFFCVLGAIAGGGTITIENVLKNPTRTGFLTILKRMGANITEGAPEMTGGLLEPVVTLTVRAGAPLQGVDMEPGLAPTLIDEIPILAIAAMFAQGPSRFRGLAELRVKESDRLQATISLVRAAGGEAAAEGDDLIVQGGAAPPAPFRFDPDEDHRLAMAAAIVAKIAKGPCEIGDPACVAVSFPGFFDALAGIG